MKRIHFKYLSIFLITLGCFGFFSFHTPQKAKPPKVNYFYFIKSKLQSDYDKTDIGFENLMLSGALTDNQKKLIKKAKKKVLLTKVDKVRGGVRKLSSGDRVIVFECIFKSNRKFSVIYYKFVKSTSKDYEQPAQYFVDQHIKTSMMSSYFLTSKILSDSKPYVIKESETTIYDYIPEKWLEEDTTKPKKKSTAIGVRG